MSDRGSPISADDVAAGLQPVAGGRRAQVDNVDGFSCLVLLVQGLDEPVVPPSQAARVVEAMRSRGIPYAYRAYEGESHGFRRRETNVDAMESSLSFHGQVLGFDPPGVPVLHLERPAG